MISKNDLSIAIKSIETISSNGKVHPDAMIQVGLSYANFKKMVDSMDDGDVLVVFKPSKKNEAAELPEQAQQEPNDAPKPKESRKKQGNK